MTSRNLNKWYALAVESGNEQRVRKTILNRLERRGVVVPNLALVCPEEELVSKTPDAEKKTILRMKLPGYILVQCRSLEDKAIVLISQAAGVMGFLGGNDHPTPLRGEDVNWILGQSETAKAQKSLFNPGDSIKVIDGPFSDFTAIILEVDEDSGTAQIELEIFGQATKAEIPLHQIAP